MDIKYTINKLILTKAEQMKITIVNKGPQLSIIDMNQFEDEIGIKLPEQYRLFMLENNGGKILPNFFNIPESTIKYSLLSKFSSINSDGYGFGTRQILNYKKDRFPDGFIPIGIDPGGNLILMGLRDSYREKVYFWDHETEPEDRMTVVEEYPNMYFLANNFNEFIGNLKNKDEL